MHVARPGPEPVRRFGAQYLNRQVELLSPLDALIWGLAIGVAVSFAVIWVALLS
jgi:hypothetical protein